MNDKVVNIILNAPKNSGVYKFKDEFNNIIYIGKAKNLKNRLKSYILYKNTQNPRLKSLYQNINDLEYEFTKNEYEALLYEASLIKQYLPRYNVLLKDDKNYPYIKIDINKPWPYLELARKIKNDGALYFGPFPEAGTIKHILRVLNKSFPLIKCRKTKFINTKPCLNYQIKRCLAPCANLITNKEYFKIVNNVVDILKGKKDLVIKQMEKAMWGYSEIEDFEQAIGLRDKILSLKKFFDSQPLIDKKRRSFDFVYLKDTITVLAFVRNGVLLGQRLAYQVEEKEELGHVLVRYYDKTGDINKLVLDFEDIDIAYLKFLENKKIKAFESKTFLESEERKKLSAILDTRILSLKEKFDRELSEQKAFKTWFKNFSSKSLKLGFKIEVYDMSHFAGTEPVGAKVVFVDLVKYKNLYRKYKIKNKALAGDDYGMMEEVLERRLKTIDVDALPQIMIVDGGKGQLSKVYNIIKNQNIFLLSIAKDKTRSKALSKDKIYAYLDGKVNKIDTPDSVLQILKRLRDEAHRFVITFERKRQNSKNFKS